eukprot:TRINITY_DN763_c0_g2_i1.p1 TRINITY_DN763_c0_g2~~TRINITY_DN763_c0_g2_i1.p1  ORF type:complete len:511 (+),score=176.29 TRINITY_DN763_c0_g2_i1:82-1533(+)
MGPAPKRTATESLTAGEAYSLCTFLSKSDHPWFSLTDCATRCALSCGTFYWYAVTHPLSFFLFSWQYNRIWYSKQQTRAFVLSLLYPALPLALIVLELVAAVQRAFSPPPEDTASKLWFSTPPGMLAPLLWGCNMNVGRMVALFMLCGRDPTALEHIIEERLTTKDFWRDLMAQGGCRVPHQVARWTGDKLVLDRPIDDTDVVIKLTDAFFGIGDQFLVNGRDFRSAADLERHLQTSTYVDYEGQTCSYRGRDVLILEYCRPAEHIGVHSMDILTVCTHEGVKVLSCLLWGECTGPSSHSTTAGYCVDIEKEEVVAPCRWYAPYFATASQKLVGMKVPGIKRACAQAIAAHSMTPHKWMKTIGWDCMILRSGEVVFFEGNFGTIRIPRRIFLAPGVTNTFLRMYSWPLAARPEVTSLGVRPPTPTGRRTPGSPSTVESEEGGLSSVPSTQTLSSTDALRHRSCANLSEHEDDRSGVPLAHAAS